MHSLWATIMQSRQGKEDMDQFSDCWASPLNPRVSFAVSPLRRVAVSPPTSLLVSVRLCLHAMAK
jgi:hypothetical protein